MTDLLTDTTRDRDTDDDVRSETAAPAAPDHPAAAAAETPADRPPGLPDKFWDDEAGRVRVDALYKSYRELEHKFGGLNGDGIPESPDGYKVNLALPGMQPDPKVNARLHEANFTRDQVQLVYDLAAEVLAPMAGHMTSDVATEMDRRRLAEHFGGADTWRELSGQLSDWGRAHLEPHAFDELARTYEGVLTLHRMMQGAEPALLDTGHAAGAPLGEEGLKELMRDPRYWRDHDPAVVRQVKEGFARLYPEPD